MPDFSAWTPTDWSAVATGVTAVVAIFAAAFAFLQVRHAKALREEQAQPFVVVDFESSPVWSNAIELVIENIGKTVATDVRVSFEPQLESSQKRDGYNIAESTLLRDGIPTMPPGKRVTALFDLSHDRVTAGLPMTYESFVAFSDSGGKRQKPLRYVLDLNFKYGLTNLTEYGMHHVAKATRDLADTLKAWQDGSHGLRVSMSDADARAFDERWQRDRGGNWPTNGDRIPAGRPTPSRFDRYRESWWKRSYWAVRLYVGFRREYAELLTKIAARPDLALALEERRRELEWRIRPWRRSTIRQER